MTDPDSPASKALVQGYEPVATAPFVYFDYAPTFGTLSGAIQIDLAARALLPLANGGVEARMVEVARLRCSPNAAAYLRDALEKALQMLNQPQDDSPGSVGRLN